MAFLEISNQVPLWWVEKYRALDAGYNFKHFDAWMADEQKLFTQVGKCKYQKWQLGDIIFIQVMADMDPIRIRVLNHVGATVDSFLMSHMVTVAGVLYFQAQITLSTYGEGYFKLQLEHGDPIQLILETETLWVLENHPRTLLLQYSNSFNNTVLYQTGIYFLMRVDGVIADFTPGSNRTTYIAQTQTAKTIKGSSFRTFTLYLGNHGGMQDWMADKISDIFDQNILLIDGKPFAAVPGAKLVPTRVDRYLWAQWKIEIQESNNRRTKRFNTTTGLEERRVVIDYDVEAKLFGPISPSVVNDNTYRIKEVG